MWNGVMNKYHNRILQMKRCQAPLAINCLTYNMRIAPVFSYVAQLVPLPDTFVERFGILCVIRCPNCMRHSDMLELYKYGGPKLRSISVSCTAALTRTALKTITAWPFWVKQFQFAYNELNIHVWNIVAKSAGLRSPYSTVWLVWSNYGCGPRLQCWQLA